MKNIILDTDIGPDCDDAGAVALLNIFKNAGLCNILGIGHCTSNIYGAGAVDAICRYYGNADINIGTTYREGFLCEKRHMSYNRELCECFPCRFKNEKPREVVSLYRELLANSPEKSVTFVAIGPLNNLSDLLKSHPDSFSPFTGKELVEKKVKELVLMAGIFPAEGECKELLKKSINKPISEYPEFNVVCDAAAAQNVSLNWNTPKFCLGYEAGLFETGFKGETDCENPVNVAYSLYTGCSDKKSAVRCSWDLFTVYFAAHESTPLFCLSNTGTVRFTEEGYTDWCEYPGGKDAYIICNEASSVIVKTVNELLALKPKV